MHNFDKVIDVAANNLGDTRTAKIMDSFVHKGIISGWKVGDYV